MTRWKVYTSARGSTIDKIESGLKLSHFTSSLPASISKDKSYCKKVHRILIDSLISKIREFSEEVEEQVKLRPCLERLDEIVQDNENQPKNGHEWRPNRIPLDNQVIRGSVLVWAYYSPKYKPLYICTAL